MSKKLITNNDIKSRVLESYKQVIKYQRRKISRMSGSIIDSTMIALNYLDLNDDFIESEVKTLITGEGNMSIARAIIRAMFNAKPLAAIKAINDVIDNYDESYNDCGNIIKDLIMETASSDRYINTKLAEPLMALLVKIENKLGCKLYMLRKQILLNHTNFIFINPFRLFTIEEIHNQIRSYDYDTLLLKLMYQLSLDLITKNDCMDILNAIPGIDSRIIDMLNKSDETGVFDSGNVSVIIDADKFINGDAERGRCTLKQFKYFNEKQGIALPLKYLSGESRYEKEDLKYIIEVMTDKLIKDKKLSAITGYNSTDRNRTFISNIVNDYAVSIDVVTASVLLRALTILYKTDTDGFSQLVSNIRDCFTPDNYRRQIGVLMPALSYSSMLFDLFGMVVPTEVIDALIGIPNSIKHLTDLEVLKNNFQSVYAIFNSQICRYFSPLNYIKLIKAWDISTFFAPFKLEDFNEDYTNLINELYNNNNNQYNGYLSTIKQIIEEDNIDRLFSCRTFGDLYLMSNYLTKNKNIEDAEKHFKDNIYLGTFVPTYSNYFSDGAIF